VPVPALWAQAPAPSPATPASTPPTTPPAQAQDSSESPIDVDSNVGYIDSALTRNVWRLRVDSAWGNNHPTRAEFFYAKGGLPGSPGPPRPETNVDYQEYLSYLEWLIVPRLSAFVEGGVRALNPTVNNNETGPGDVNAGFKWTFLTCDEGLATFQLRTYVPTGNKHEGLGTGHVSLEPALLFNYHPIEGLTFEGEVRYWVPVGGTDFAGDVLRYGLGLSWGERSTDSFWMTPVLEWVGWTVLSGKQLDVVAPDVATVQSAAGQTIVNAKCGVRMGLNNRADLYVGYGRGLTGPVWYRDVVRVEFRWLF
jgi:hypothetical protein